MKYFFNFKCKFIFIKALINLLFSISSQHQQNEMKTTYRSVF